MRTIKFRAKRIPDQTWVYGDLTHCLRVTVDADIPCIRIAGYDCDETTIGQFTGLMDKNGNEIYEGDIIASEGYSQARHYIRYLEDEAMFIAMIIGSPLQEWCAIRQSWIEKFDKKVIGNIHDRNIEPADTDITCEQCPHCDYQVKLKAELSVQKCPACGKQIVSCTMCDKDECSQDCPYRNQANKLNMKGVVL